MQRLDKKIEYEEAYLHLNKHDPSFQSYWYNISMNEQLSENFIRTFKDYVYWYNISIYQNLSETFVREFADYIDFEYIWKFNVYKEQYSPEFIEYCKQMEDKQFEEAQQEFLFKKEHKTC